MNEVTTMLDMNKVWPCKLHRIAYLELTDYEDSRSIDGYVDKDDCKKLYDKTGKLLDEFEYRLDDDDFDRYFK